MPRCALMVLRWIAELIIEAGRLSKAGRLNKSCDLFEVDNLVHCALADSLGRFSKGLECISFELSSLRARTACGPSTD